jgi:hypothetical protein
MEKELEKPADLSPLGTKAYDAILEFLAKDGVLEAESKYGITGGCTAFYSPQAWRERGEIYGRAAELIVVYDGGALGPYFSLDHDYPKYRRIEAMQEHLRSIGLYAEECTGWYCAIYKI